MRYALAGDDDAALFDIDSKTGELSFKSPPDFEAAQDVNNDNVYQVNVQATNAKGESATQTVSVTVTNADEAPVFSNAEDIFVRGNPSLFPDGLIKTYAVSDPESGTVTLSLKGPDAAAFTIDGMGLKILSGQDLPKPTSSDFVYRVTVVATDGAGNEAENKVSFQLTDLPPVIEVLSAINILAEADPSNLQVAELSVTDPLGKPIYYSLTGASADLFQLVSKTSNGVTTQVLEFKAAPDYERPGSPSNSNSYQVEVVAENLAGDISSRLFVVDVTDVNEAPHFRNAEDVYIHIEDGNRLSDFYVEAVDPEGAALTYRFVGDNAGLFNINQQTGHFSMLNPVNFEDLDPTDPYIRATLEASDGTHTSSKQVNIFVTNVNEAPIFTDAGNDLTVDENTKMIAALPVSDPDGDKVTFNPLTGNDADLFELVKTVENGVEVVRLAFKEAPNFENPQASDDTNTYRVTVSVSDGAASTSQDYSVTVDDVDEAPMFTYEPTTRVEVIEGLAYSLDFFEATDPEGQSLTFSLSGDAAAQFTIDEIGTLSSLGQNFDTPEDANRDNIYVVTGTASDGVHTIQRDLEIEILKKYSGTSADDNFVGTDRNENFYGKGGTDVLTGGGGSDTFEFSVRDPGHTEITDFDSHEDVLFLSDLSDQIGEGLNAEDFLTAERDQNGKVKILIQHDGQTSHPDNPPSITLSNINYDDVPTDFLHGWINSEAILL